MNITAYATAQKALVLLQEAVLLCVQEKPGRNKAEIGRIARIDDFVSVKQKGHLTRATLHALKNSGLSDSTQEKSGAQNHWKIKSVERVYG
jgi:hypothetical protein